MTELWAVDADEAKSASIDEPYGVAIINMRYDHLGVDLVRLARASVERVKRRDPPAGPKNKKASEDA